MPKRAVAAVTVTERPVTPAKRASRSSQSTPVKLTGSTVDTTDSSFVTPVKAEPGVKAKRTLSTKADAAASTHTVKIEEKLTTPRKRKPANTSSADTSTSSTDAAAAVDAKPKTPRKRKVSNTNTLATSSTDANIPAQLHNILPSVDDIVSVLPLIRTSRPQHTTPNDTVLFTLPVPSDFNLATTICSFGFWRLPPTCWFPSNFHPTTHSPHIVSSAHGGAGTSAKADFDTFDTNAEQNLTDEQYWTRDIHGHLVRSYNFGDQYQHVLWLALTQIEVQSDDSSNSSGDASSAYDSEDKSLLHCITTATQRSTKHIVVKQLKPVTAVPTSIADVEYTTADQLSDVDIATVIQQFIRMLRLYDDFTQYNTLIDQLNVRDEHLVNLGKVNYLSRLYRSPTLWEDLCKAQLVTNITWSRTVQCCALLCQHVSTDGVSWPTPHDVVRVGVRYLEVKCNVGYRAERLIRLAQECIDAQLCTKLTDMANDKTVSTHELYKAVLSLYGYGAFAANNVVQLLGRYDVVPSDSETARHLKLVTGMRKDTKLDMKQVDVMYGQRYNKFAPYQYLVYWSELWNNYEKHMLAQTAAWKPPVMVKQKTEV